MNDIIQILVVGTNQPIMETIARLIDKDGKWKATIAKSVEEACSHCHSKVFQLTLIGAGLSALQEDELKRKLLAIYPTLPIVKHYGGGSGLLYAEIYQGLSK